MPAWHRAVIENMADASKLVCRYLGVLLHKYACNSAVLRRSPLNVLEVVSATRELQRKAHAQLQRAVGLEALAPELFPSALHDKSWHLPGHP